MIQARFIRFTCCMSVLFALLFYPQPVRADLFPVNMAVNGGFEYDGGWFQVGGAAYSTAIKIEGSRSLSIPPGALALVPGGIPAGVVKGLYLSYYANTVSASDNTLFVNVHKLSDGSTICGFSSLVLKNAWYSYHNFCTVNTDDSIYISLSVGITAVNAVNVDDFRLYYDLNNNDAAAAINDKVIGSGVGGSSVLASTVYSSSLAAGSVLTETNAFVTDLGSNTRAVVEYRTDIGTVVLIVFCAALLVLGVAGLVISQLKRS